MIWTAVVIAFLPLLSQVVANILGMIFSCNLDQNTTPNCTLGFPLQVMYSLGYLTMATIPIGIIIGIVGFIVVMSAKNSPK